MVSCCLKLIGTENVYLKLKKTCPRGSCVTLKYSTQEIHVWWLYLIPPEIQTRGCDPVAMRRILPCTTHWEMGLVGGLSHYPGLLLPIKSDYLVLFCTWHWGRRSVWRGWDVGEGDSYPPLPIPIMITWSYNHNDKHGWNPIKTLGAWVCRT